jgi:hypothetical protein
MIAAMKRGSLAGTPNACKQGLPIVLIADKKFADNNPSRGKVSCALPALVDMSSTRRPRACFRVQAFHP